MRAVSEAGLLLSGKRVLHTLRSSGGALLTMPAMHWLLLHKSTAYVCVFFKDTPA